MSPPAPYPCSLRNLSLLLCFCMVSLVLGQTYDYGFDVAKAFKAKRQLEGDFIITSGAPVNGEIVPTRPEIRNLQQDPDKWSLYVLALDMMQYTVQQDPTSWFAITGMLHCTTGLNHQADHLSPQAFTACRSSRGTVFSRHLAMRSLVTANT